MSHHGQLAYKYEHEPNMGAQLEEKTTWSGFRTVTYWEKMKVVVVVVNGGDNANGISNYGC